MRKSSRGQYMVAMAALVVGLAPAVAQYGGASREGGGGISTRQAVDAAILSSVSRDRQADRDSRRIPYATPGYGPIGTAKAARDACSAEALGEVGGAARVLGKPVASTMSTGWEVEGEIEESRGGAHIPFVCSVRNGSVSGIKLD